jgi:hypothetical protein
LSVAVVAILSLLLPLAIAAVTQLGVLISQLADLKNYTRTIGMTLTSFPPQHVPPRCGQCDCENLEVRPQQKEDMD